MEKKFFIILLVLLVSINSLFSMNDESLINYENAPIKFFVDYEAGFFVVSGHTIQIGSTGTEFNYVTQGGQEILLPFQRFNVGATLFDRHRISFLYQPLEINTKVKFRENVTIDGITFDSGKPMELKYGFPFYRITYSYDLIKDPNRAIAIGAALQIRNASIVFQSADVEKITVSQNVGPVPAINIYSFWKLSSGITLTADITGLYA